MLFKLCSGDGGWGARTRSCLPGKRRQRGVRVESADGLVQERGKLGHSGALFPVVQKHAAFARAARDLQQEINEQLPALRDHVQAGRYAEAVSLGNRLLGASELTGNQVVTIQRELAVGYVALDRMDLAQAAFVAALERQPDLELDTRRTSPMPPTPSRPRSS